MSAVIAVHGGAGEISDSRAAQKVISQLKCFIMQIMSRLTFYKDNQLYLFFS